MSKKNVMEISVNIFQCELLAMVKDIVWKDKYTANLYENNTDPKIVDQFLAVNRGLLTFDSIYQFDINALKAVGFVGDILEQCLENKYYIPEDMRDLASKAHCNELLKKDQITGRYIHYKEMNNYYRRLYGLPDIEDTDYIYNTKYDDIDKTTPIHELPITDRYTLEERGYIDELIKKYPKKKYLKYIASKMIDPYKSRTADRFDILWINTTGTANMNQAFLDVYDNCRQTVIRTYYRSDMGKSNELYEGFIAICILFMSINLMFYKYLETDITRDFFDIESLKYVYESYGVPFYPLIPINLHKKIVKNINILLSYKGSTRVFYKLFDLFGYGQIDIYEYYMLKIHKVSSDGTPIFNYDKDGNPKPEDDYNIKFGEVKLYEDPPLELADPGNHLDYTEMTSNDPYWVSDPALLDKLMKEKFNFLETKYLGIKTVFDMLEIVYESAFFYKIILDNRYLLEKTLIFFGGTNKFYNIFVITIYIAAIICRKHGYEGVISSKLPIVSKIIGYNFKADITLIRKDCMEDDILKNDNELFEYLLSINVNSLDSINRALDKIRDLKKFLLDRMWRSKTEEVYTAYRDLYQTLITSDFIEDVFKKKNGEVAESFSELLKDLSIELYVRMTSDGFDLDEELDSLFILFEKSFESLKWIRYSDGLDLGPLLEQLFLLLKFFKSAKVELTDYRIVYMISKPEANFIKFIGEIMSQEHSILGPDDRFDWLTDLVRLYEKIVYADRFMKIKDDYQHILELKMIDDKFDKIKDELIECITKVRDTQAIIYISDYLTHVKSWTDIYSKLGIEDCNHLFSEDVLYPTIFYILDDSLLILKTLIYMIEECDRRPESIINFNTRIHDIVEWIIDIIGKQRTELWLTDLLLEAHFIIYPDHFNYLIDKCNHLFSHVFVDDQFIELKDKIFSCIEKFRIPSTILQLSDYIRNESSDDIISSLTLSDCAHIFSEEFYETEELYEFGNSVMQLKSAICMIEEEDRRMKSIMCWNTIIHDISEIVTIISTNSRSKFSFEDWLIEYHQSLTEDKFEQWKDSCKNFMNIIYPSSSFNMIQDAIINCISAISGKNTALQLSDGTMEILTEDIFSNLTIRDLCNIFTEEFNSEEYKKIGESILRFKAELSSIENEDMRSEAIIAWNTIICDIYEIVSYINNDKGTIFQLSDKLLIHNDTILESKNLKFMDTAIEYKKELWYGSFINYATKIIEVYEETHKVKTNLFLTAGINGLDENTHINDKAALFHDSLQLIYERIDPD